MKQGLKEYYGARVVRKNFKVIGNYDKYGRDKENCNIETMNISEVVDMFLKPLNFFFEYAVIAPLEIAFGENYLRIYHENNYRNRKN
jgi:hypothetical protein